MMEKLVSPKFNSKQKRNLITIGIVFLIALLGSQIVFAFFLKFTNFYKREEYSFDLELSRLISRLEITFNPQNIEDFLIKDPDSVDNYFKILKPEYSEAKKNYKKLVKVFVTEIILNLSDKPELINKVFNTIFPYEKTYDVSDYFSEPITLSISGITGVFIPDMKMYIADKGKVEPDLFFSLKRSSLLYIGIEDRNKYSSDKTSTITISGDSELSGNIFLSEYEFPIMPILLIVKIEQKKYILGFQEGYTFEFINPATRKSSAKFKTKGIGQLF